MNGRIVELEGSVHGRVDKLLPWVLVDGLRGAELAMVQAHLRDCEACRSELAWQRRLIDAGPLPVPAGADVDRAFAALSARLRPAAPRRAAAWCSAWRESLRGRWMGWALAAQSLAIAALAVSLWLPAAPVYHTLGRPAADSGKVLVMFRAETTEAALRGTLLRYDARIVDGPNERGAYLLQLPRGAARVAALRAEPGVALAESLDPGAPQ